MPRFGRPSRFKPRAYKRYKAARQIQRAFRLRRCRSLVRRSNRQRYNSQRNTSTTTVGSYRKKKTLRKRVSALEVSSKKHHDIVSLTPELVTWNGTDLIPSKNSYDTVLAIQGPLNDGTANAQLDEDEQRESDTIHCTSIRFKGTLHGVRPQDLGAIDAEGTMGVWAATQMQRLCHSKFTITILRDTRPSAVNVATGDSEVNPLPVGAAEIAISTLYSATLTGGNQLQFFGANNSLRNYKNSRFKLMHQEMIETSFQKPNKDFSISLKIDKKLKYVPPRGGTPPPQNVPAKPYNYGICFFVTCVTPPAPVSWATALSPPSLSQKTARTYFTDTG